MEGPVDNDRAEADRYPIKVMLRNLGMLTAEEDEPSAFQLFRSEDLTMSNIDGLKADINNMLKPASRYKNVDVVACGSLARHEWTPSSDFDYLIIIEDPSDVTSQDLRNVQREMARLVKQKDLNPPGATGTFGQVITSFDLINKIGRETDTNAVTTRRILMLEESVSLMDERQHMRLVEGILKRYLSEYRSPESSVARLIVNDVMKYWRTIAVDYSSKNWSRITDDGWGLRYLKLRITRKLAFASMLAAMFDVPLRGDALTEERLYENLRIPPLARLGLLYDNLEDNGKEALRECLRIAGGFNRMLFDQDFRATVGELEWDGMRTKPYEFREAETLSRELQTQLEELFFRGSRDLGALTMKFAVF
jgi:predicted nucleotidyltransferase